MCWLRPTTAAESQQAYRAVLTCPFRPPGRPAHRRKRWKEPPLSLCGRPGGRSATLARDQRPPRSPGTGLFGNGLERNLWCTSSPVNTHRTGQDSSGHPPRPVYRSYGGSVLAQADSLPDPQAPTPGCVTSVGGGLLWPTVSAPSRCRWG